MAKEFIVRVSAPSPTGKSPLKSRESNESYFYPVTRAVSYWPVVNGNGAFFEEDKLAPLINSTDEEDGFIGKLVNIWHKKGVDTGNQIIGAIKDQAAVPGSGVDLMARIDKKAAEVYGIEIEDFGVDKDYSSSSIEILCDFEKSIWVALTNPASQKLEDQTIFTPDQAEEMGMSRTAESGYKYQDKYTVVEGCSPIRCRGLAFMDDPADSTANVFELAANMKRGKMTLEELMADQKALTPGKFHADPGFLPDKKERYQLDTPKHVKDAASLFGMHKDKYNPEEQHHILSAIAEARTRLGMKDETASFSDDVGYCGDDFDDMDVPHHYEDITCSDMGDEESNALPDDAFAAAYTTADGHSRVRKLPLYRTKADFEKQKPEPGLVKAAITSLQKSSYDGGVDLHPNLHAEARNKVRTAHKHLFPQGANQVEPKDIDAMKAAAFADGAASKNDEIAALNTKVTTLTTERDSAKDEIANLTTKYGELEASLTTVKEEKATLEGKIAEKTAEETASTRFAELSAIDGFSAGTDEEKAALLASLKTEDEVAFKFRKLTETNASLERRLAAAPKEKTVEEKAALAEEQATRNVAMRSGLDSMPVHGSTTEDGKTVDATMSIM